MYMHKYVHTVFCTMNEQMKGTKVQILRGSVFFLRICNGEIISHVHIVDRYMYMYVRIYICIIIYMYMYITYNGEYAERKMTESRSSTHRVCLFTYIFP